MDDAEGFPEAFRRQAARNPISCSLLDRLLVMDEAGLIGLCKAHDMLLEDLAGDMHDNRGRLRIAHAFHLQVGGLLSQWQQRIVHRRIVQPFKQAFREFYVLTPAEEDTRVFSMRFAGQVVDSARAARLLGAEDWECTNYEWPKKSFPEAGISAYLSFTEEYHYMGEANGLEIADVYFLPSSAANLWSTDNDVRLPLAEIPPVIFSEVMRDVDLVVSVAQYTGTEEERARYRVPDTKYEESPEIIERRGDLVRSLASDFGYANITVVGNIARISGSLSDYRVHLASGVIHIEPGSYLCIVPDRWGEKHDKLFLPFDTTDDKTSEVISKILLLAEDEKIKDKSILDQIKRPS